MSGRRFVGLSSQQPVPRLLTVIGNSQSAKKMKEVDVDAPPLSSSDSSDNEGLPTRADIRPSVFRESHQKKYPPRRRDSTDSVEDKTAVSTERFKRTRTSARSATRKQRGPDPKNTVEQPESVNADDVLSSPISKKAKTNPPSDEEQGRQLEQGIFAVRESTVSRKYGKSRFFGSKARQKTSSAKAPKPRREKQKSESVSPTRPGFRTPPPLPGGSSSPICKPRTIPKSDFDAPANASPTGESRFRMPKDDIVSVIDREDPDESQRPAFRMPGALPESSTRDGPERPDIPNSPAAGAPTASDLLPDSSTTLSETESVALTPVCPLCRKEVDKALLDEFTKKHRRMTISAMRKFCEQHKRRSARETWVSSGYPDIQWELLDKRIARHYTPLREILEGRRPSHYGRLFEVSVRSGRNRTLLRSDVNLTPGYYGMRGLRAMTENLITEFAPVLRRRSLEDRLVAARGHTMYLQSVLVPELAVRLIMEDMGVDEKEARVILTKSSDVGELLNDEIADVVLDDSDEDD